MSRRHNCETDNRNNPEDNNNERGIEKELENFIGKTVTIFTTSGGESGSGFTGVLIRVNSRFVTLITKIGPAPGCALGNACTDTMSDITDDEDEFTDHRRTTRRTTRRRRVIRNLGAETDIPIDRIASFVHNAV